MTRTITLGTGPITIEEFVAVARHGAQVAFAPEYVERVVASCGLVDRFLAENRLIYGVTTGFGNNYTRVIDPSDAVQLQQNIVISHAVSVGEPLPDEQVRAIQLMELVSLGQGYSGTRIETLELIRRLLNRRVTPVAPGSGSVGYLAIEAHLALVLIGQGRAVIDGAVVDGATALDRAGLAPVQLRAKEGLTLTNGCHSVTAIAVLAVHDIRHQARHADLLGSMGYEALTCTTRALDPRLHALRAHPEQAASARNLLRLLEGSAIAARSRDHRTQDPYMFRSMAQLHGAARRSVADAAAVLEESLQSIGDNPVLIPDGAGDGEAIMGGNFDGTFIGLASDSLTTAATVLGKVSERRIDRMVNSAFSGLPAFLAPHPGLDNGLMIPQYTAAALVMEMRADAAPASVDSIPTSGNQEDPVSNAYLAAQQAYRVAGKLRYVHAIELLCAAQALDLLDAPEHSSPAVAGMRAVVRERVPFAAHDRLFGRDIESLAELLGGDAVLAAAESVTGPLE